MDQNRRPESMERITTPALAESFIKEQVEAIQQQVGSKKVLLALSGGVDSSVVAALLIRAVGKQLVCVHVNHGLLRKGEPEQVVKVFRDEMDANLVYVDAVDRFLDKLAGVSDPEQKRKIIGAEFIRVFEEEARKQEGIEFLAQGTIYPDILESGGVKALDAISEPFLHLGIEFFVKGGVTLENMRGYLMRREVVAVSAPWIASPELVAAKDWKRIAENAAEAVNAVQTIRKTV